jgi:Gram-negative bacterial TonB protein C-terminal
MRTFLFLIALTACSPREPVSDANVKPGRPTPSGETTAPVDVRRGIVPAEARLRPLKVGGDVKAPVVISRVEPKFSKHLHVSGPLILEAIIDKTGKAREVRIIRDGTNPPQGSAYAEAIKQWRFRPGTLRGKPVDVTWECSVIIDVR